MSEPDKPEQSDNETSLLSSAIIPAKKGRNRFLALIVAAGVAITLIVVFAVTRKPAPIPGVLGTWTLPVRTASVATTHSWGSHATLKDYVSSNLYAFRNLTISIYVASTTTKDQWFSPYAEIHWDTGRIETCHDNGGLRNRLYFRPNGGNEVLISVVFSCESSTTGSLTAGGYPGNNAYVIVYDS